MTREFRLGSLAAGDGHPVVIVAETGINHNGSIEIASNMISRAAEAGVGAVKFQTFSAEEFMSGPDQTYTYTSNGRTITESMLDMFKRCEIPAEGFRELFDFARKSGLIPFSTPTDFEGAKKIAPFGLPAIKVGSDDLVNIPLLKELASLNLPMILSTGMADPEEISLGLETSLKFGSPSVALMVCTSLYPTPAGGENLRRISTLRCRFPDTVIGFSDHTMGISAACLAVALGASIIEKHFTLDRSMAGPDHWFSSDPEEMRKLVRAIRVSELALGTGEVGPEPGELEMRTVARRSVAAKNDIPKGKIIEKGDLCCKRPGTGIPPGRLEALIGLTAARFIPSNSLIHPEDLSAFETASDFPGGSS